MYIFLLIVIICWHRGLTQQLLDIRLTGGPSNSSGRVEILSENGEWGTVCDDFWDLQDALVVCRQLGLGPALEAPIDATFGEGNGPIYLDDVECLGNEESLFDCDSGGVGNHNCGHDEDAGVVCVNLATYSEIRLTGGMASSEGRVEVLFNGRWGTICNNSWDLNAANVVCRELGYPAAEVDSIPTTFGAGRGPIWLDDVRCHGNESSLASCFHNDFGIHNCGHKDDVGVKCQEEERSHRFIVLIKPVYIYCVNLGTRFLAFLLWPLEPDIGLEPNSTRTNTPNQTNPNQPTIQPRNQLTN